MEIVSGYQFIPGLGRVWSEPMYVADVFVGYRILPVDDRGNMTDVPPVYLEYT